VRILLDTHALLWWLTDHKQLGSKAKAIIADGYNDVFISAASTWEIAIKKMTGLVNTPDDMENVIISEGFKPLAINHFHTQHAGALSLYHNDLFDRMLIAQAQIEGLQVITNNPQFPQYKVRVIDALT
jgi:PIN domain nuclease of toxin-antitoxin system